MFCRLTNDLGSSCYSTSYLPTIAPCYNILLHPLLNQGYWLARTGEYYSCWRDITITSLTNQQKGWRFESNVLLWHHGDVKNASKHVSFIAVWKWVALIAALKQKYIWDAHIVRAMRRRSQRSEDYFTDYPILSSFEAVQNNENVTIVGSFTDVL